MSIPTRHVFATYLKIDGVPCEGYVEFTLVTEAVIEDVAIIPISTVTAVLDETGRIDADLLVSDDPLVQPEGLYWFIEEKIENGNVWYMQVPTGDGSPINLGDLYVPGLVPPYMPLVGPAGPPGPPGMPGTGSQYIHIQGSLSDNWLITHSMNKHPVVTIEDNGGTVMYGSIYYIDNNNLSISFGSTAVGKANCT